MTRKDYIKIAGAIREARARINKVTYNDTLEQYGVDQAEQCIAEVLAEEDCWFDRDRFAKACAL